MPKTTLILDKGHSSQREVKWPEDWPIPSKGDKIGGPVRTTQHGAMWYRVQHLQFDIDGKEIFIYAEDDFYR
jgi:hypothetical protein